MSDFIAADPREQAQSLDIDGIDVWRLDYHPASGREPLRRLLAAYLDLAPASVHFVDGEHGRPALAPPACGLDFNWTHSGSHALVALARQQAVLGIDYETRRSRPRALALARRFFHADEHAQLQALAPARVSDAFLRLWTAKEAVLKALGEGIRFGLDRVVFHLDGDETQPADFDPAAGPVTDWRLLRHDDAAGFVCLAWRGRPRRIRWFQGADA